MLRKAALLMFAEDQPAVDFNIKDASGPFDEFGLNADFICDYCCQTGSLGGVVSNDTVRDTDSHGAFQS